MKITVSFYGHDVDVDVGYVADQLHDPDVRAEAHTNEALDRALYDDIAEQLLESQPAFYITGGMEELRDAVREKLREMEEGQ